MTGQKLYTDEIDLKCLFNIHGCSVADSVTPIDIDRSPKYADVWKYVCGR